MPIKTNELLTLPEAIKHIADHHGNPHLLIHHDDGCPVLTGAVSSIPDTLRAAHLTHYTRSASVRGSGSRRPAHGACAHVRERTTP